MTAKRHDLAPVAGVVAVAVILALGPSTAAAEPPAVGGAPSTGIAPMTQPPTTPSTVVLSNETTVTTWAHPVEEARIREHPASTSRTIARIRLETEDGLPEVYLVMSRFTDAEGRVWLCVRVPGRPNGRIGWLGQSALGELHVTHWLIEVSLSHRRLRAYYSGKLRFTALVGVGKPSTPTPPGHSWIRERIRVRSRSNPYWPYALGTSDYSTLTEWPGGGVIGIHSDLGQPQLIPGAPSHGCVRMRDPDIAWLATRVQLGTPVHIVR